MSSASLSVLRGTLDALALRTLANGRELHGFEIIEWIHESSGDELHVEEGALYPALHRMERRGWLASRWRVSEKGRRAKYYRLTAGGRSALAKAERQWARYVTAVARLARAAGAVR